MSERPSSKELPQFNAPPPPLPPPAAMANADSMGLATEVVFSGQRRRELRDSLRSMESVAQETPRTIQQPHSVTEDSHPGGFDDTQNGPTDSADQRFALTSFILMSLIGLGILVLLVLLMYLVILG